MLYKKIHIGQSIKDLVDQQGISIERICKFLNKDEQFVKNVFESQSIDSEMLLRWSKLLEYDFFRLYTSHLILYSPPSAVNRNQEKSPVVLQFRKNIYTQEIKEFIIKQITSGKMTQSDVITQYSIPKSTLHRWLQKNVPKT